MKKIYAKPSTLLLEVDGTEIMAASNEPKVESFVIGDNNDEYAPTTAEGKSIGFDSWDE